MKTSAYQLIFAILVLIPLSSAAETIYLKDGSTITGKIKNIGADQVVITTVIGEVSIESTKILRVDGISNSTQAAEQKDQTSRAAEPTVKSYPDSHMQQKNGLGFGPGIGSMLGINFFYDRNLSTQSQFHIQLNANAGSRSSYWWEQIIKTNRTMLFATYRYFPVESIGFYLGAGGGYADGKLEYNNSSWDGSTPYEYTSKLSGTFVMGEVGWQGKDGYYFNVGFQPAAFIASNDNFDVNSIPNTSNHRIIANEEHDNLKSLSQISVGFGWFF